MDSQANRMTRTLEENFYRMESELCNVRREMDKLRNAIKDKAVETLEKMI